jgi:uncharacterized protein
MSRRIMLFIGSAIASVALLAFLVLPLAGNTASNAARTGGAVAAATPLPADGALRTVSVNGQGQVKVAPDLATITFAVETSGTTLAAAQGENATRMTAVLDKLKGLGIASADLQTSGYTINPQYDRDQKLTGYRVNNGVRAIVRDLSKLGATIDGTVAAGANRVTGISFDVANKADAIRQARELAVTDARAKAEQYAKLTGVTLGGPVTINENTVTPVARTAAAGGAASDMPTTPIEAGESVIVLTVQISYEIK